MNHSFNLDHVITWILTNFSLTALIVALLFILLHRVIKRQMPESEIVYRWISFFAVGVVSLYAFAVHAFYPLVAANSIGWPLSPFQYEVAMANLAIGVIAILSFNASFGFRLATTIAVVIWWWGDAFNHLCQLIRFHNFAPGNAGSWLMTDILVPIILICAIRKLRRMQYL